MPIKSDSIWWFTPSKNWTMKFFTSLLQMILIGWDGTEQNRSMVMLCWKNKPLDRLWFIQGWIDSFHYACNHLEKIIGRPGMDGKGMALLEMLQSPNIVISTYMVLNHETLCQLRREKNPYIWNGAHHISCIPNKKKSKKSSTWYGAWFVV